MLVLTDLEENIIIIKNMSKYEVTERSWRDCWFV